MSFEILGGIGNFNMTTQSNQKPLRKAEKWKLPPIHFEARLLTLRQVRFGIPVFKVCGDSCS